MFGDDSSYYKNQADNAKRKAKKSKKAEINSQNAEIAARNEVYKAKKATENALKKLDNERKERIKTENELSEYKKTIREMAAETKKQQEIIRWNNLTRDEQEVELTAKKEALKLEKIRKSKELKLAKEVRISEVRAKEELILKEYYTAIEDYENFNYLNSLFSKIKRCFSRPKLKAKELLISMCIMGIFAVVITIVLMIIMAFCSSFLHLSMFQKIYESKTSGGNTGWDLQLFKYPSINVVGWYSLGAVLGGLLIIGAFILTLRSIEYKGGGLVRKPKKPIKTHEIELLINKKKS